MKWPSKIERASLKIVPVILAGGVGSRLWPLSRKARPKPFVSVDKQQTLIQKTYSRVSSMPGTQEVLTVTNQDLFLITKDEYEKLPASIFNSFILEPVGRNSAAAIALAAQYVEAKYGVDAVLLVLPSDHVIAKPQAFYEAVDDALTLALEGKLVTFGIQPDSPKTGYGYIQANGRVVERFVEKPDAETAKQYVKAGNFLWNSGMFCMKAGSILRELRVYCPSILDGTKLSLDNAKVSHGPRWEKRELSVEDFRSVQDISIDYAVFEKSKNVSVVACDIGWSDIGSWLEFGEFLPKANNNHVLGRAVLDDVENCIVYSESRLVAAVGLDNLVIADTPDALLVMDRNRTQDVRQLYKNLELQKDPTCETSATTHRPWGTYTVLQEGQGFKIKRIEVKPKASLSLQSHKHRSEHWVVVSGTARITNGNNVLKLSHNESTFISAGSLHRLENPEDEPLIIVEVQCGSYLGEDDITRYDDVYGRGTSSPTS